jgi:hypothetical protein
MASGPARGLTRVATEDLKRLLRHLYRQEITCPLTAGELARVGLQDRSEPLLDLLRGLDHAATRAVVVAVLAEREVG